MKNMLSSTVETSKACALLTRSSAPFMDRHLLTSITPRGWESYMATHHRCPVKTAASKAAFDSDNYDAALMLC